MIERGNDWYDEKCQCGHERADHHVSWFRGGAVLVEECEFFGSNEMGGKDEEGNDHCNVFRKLNPT